jgi:hypothetical protein
MVENIGVHPNDENKTIHETQLFSNIIFLITKDNSLESELGTYKHFHIVNRSYFIPHLLNLMIESSATWHVCKC